MTEDENMREFIEIVNYYSHLNESVSEPVVEEPVEVLSEHVIFNDLDDLVFKLRAFMETDNNEYSLGVETGMQRAADMVERILRNYRGNMING